MIPVLPAGPFPVIALGLGSGPRNLSAKQLIVADIPRGEAAGVSLRLAEDGVVAPAQFNQAAENTKRMLRPLAFRRGVFHALDQMVRQIPGSGGMPVEIEPGTVCGLLRRRHRLAQLVQADRRSVPRLDR